MLNRVVSTVEQNGVGKALIVKLLLGLVAQQDLSAKFIYTDFLTDSKFPIDPSSLTRFRQRIGEKGVQRIFKTTISMTIDYGFVPPKSLEKVIVDTTVMEKNVSHPTDAKLYYKARERTVNWCIRRYFISRPFSDKQSL